jgi:predicted aspartyl protease
MRDRFRWFVVLLGLVLAGQPFALGEQEIGPRRPIEGTVNFDLYRGYLMIARGSAGTVKGLTFLLDTGASSSVLDPQLARKLHLQRLPASMSVLGGSVQAEKSVAPSLNVGLMQRENVPVLIEDLSFLQKALPVRVDAIIGLDVLGQTAFVIDYAARQIHLGPLPALPDAIPLHMAGGLAILDAQVNNLPARLLLDTGASSLFLFARSTPGAISDVRVSAVQQSSGTIGESERKQVKLHSLRLGTTEFAQEPAFLVPDGSNGGHPFDGLISPAGLGVKRVAIDLARGEAAFSR